MSWFKRVSGKPGEERSSPSPLRQVLAQHQHPGSRSPGSVSRGSTSRGSVSSAGSLDSVIASGTAGNNPQNAAPGPAHNNVNNHHHQHLCGTDPDTCYEVFQMHWKQAWAIMAKTGSSPQTGAMRRNWSEDTEAVIRYVDQMVLLLVEEEAQDGGQGPILQYLLMEDILEKLLSWASQVGEQGDRFKLHQLKMYELLISQSRQQLLHHKPVIRPILKLLSACKEHTGPDIETHLILILHQLCVCVTRYTHILELLFDGTSDHGPARFLMFSLLIPYIHREGGIGQQARDALLLIMSLSSQHQDIGRHVAQNSDFCPVLATGLSGLYSSLPRKIDYPSDDWNQIMAEDIASIPDLVLFLNSLEFCNAVVQVAHPLVRDQLLRFIYDGFLVPVLCPALHQNDIKYNEMELQLSPDLLFWDETEEESDMFNLPISVIESYFGSSMEEVIAATAYLDLFLRRVTEPALMQTFLRFILTEKHEGVNIIDSLVMRINSNSRLCMVTLSLFRTLVDLNCEDVMYQLLFKYLSPCTHVMVSQRRAVRDVDLYSKTAEKLLSLRPACCTTDAGDWPQDGATVGSQGAADNISIASSSSSVADSLSEASAPVVIPAPVAPPKARRFLFGRRAKSTDQEGGAATPTNNTPTNTPDHRSSSPDSGGVVPNQSPGGSTVKPAATDTQEMCYLEYLHAAQLEIDRCVRATQCWSLPYDGEHPSTDHIRVFSIMDVGSGHDEVSAVEPQEAPSSDRDLVSSVLPAKDHSVALDTSSCNGDAGTGSRPGLATAACPTLRQSTPVREQGLPEMTSPPGSGDVTGGSPGSKDVKQGSCADSVTSEADSAISGGSSVTDNQQSSTGLSPSRPDSPMSDTFDNTEFNSFLLSLKRMKTPVEFSDGLDPEDSFSEIDSLVSELKSLDMYKRQSTSSTSSLCVVTKHAGDAVPPGLASPVEAPSDQVPAPAQTLTSHPPSTLPTFVDPTPPPGVVRPEPRTGRPGSPLPHPDADPRPHPDLHPHPHADPHPTNDVRNKHSGGEDIERLLAAKPETNNKSSSSPEGVAAARLSSSSTTPDIGPFLTTLLNRLECMMQNTLYVNLLLTGLVTRLACYPQPLLRSFLLNHTLVFQPTVKSLIQVLGSVKHKVDCYSYTVKDFDSMMHRAKLFLSWRDEVYLSSVGDKGAARRESAASMPGSLLQQRDAQKAEKRRGSSISDILFRRNNTRPTPRLQLLGDKRGFRYVNKQQQIGAPPGEGTVGGLEALKTKNAVYCALVLEEFLKELAAISQEHAVLGQGGAGGPGPGGVPRGAGVVSISALVS